MVIDEADQRAIEEVTGEHGREQPGDQARAPVERDGAQRPHRGHRQHADHRRHEGGDALDVSGGRAGAPREHDRGRDDGVEERGDGDVLAVGRRVRIHGDAMREVADLALRETDVVPGIGFEEVDAGAAEHVIPRGPEAQGRGNAKDGREKHQVQLFHGRSR